MSEGVPKVFSSAHTEKPGVPSENKEEHIPSYLEDPEVRQERDIRELRDALSAHFKKLSLSGELEALKGDALIERVGDLGTVAALALVEKKYGAEADPESRLAYHDRAHSEAVVRRVGELVAAINTAKPGTISVLENTLVRLDAANHDDEHVFYVKEGIRMRKPGEGEERSAVRLTELKRAINENLSLYGKGEQLPIDPARDKRAIDVTVPEFVPGTGIIQKHLNRDTPLTDRLLAFADLGDFGMEGPQRLLETGKKLAIEDNADIVEAVRAGGISSELKDRYRGRLLAFMQFQPTFAESRYHRFAEELEGINDSVVERAIREQFTYFKQEAFDTARRELNEEMTKIAPYTFEEVMAYVGIPEFIQDSPDSRSAT